MARYRLSGPAKADVAAILKRSEELHGKQARIRCRSLRTAAMRRVATAAKGPATSDRTELRVGLRSFHICHSRNESQEAAVANPVHVIFYRTVQPTVVEIVRVLHERMDPGGHIVGTDEHGA